MKHWKSKRSIKCEEQSGKGTFMSKSGGGESKMGKLTRQLWGRNGAFWEEWFQDSYDDESSRSVEADDGRGGFEGCG